VQRLLDAGEREGRARSRALHGGPGQTLAVARLLLGQLAGRLEDDDARQLAEVSELLGDALAELRRLEHALHPPTLDDLGLAPALRWLLREGAGASLPDAELVLDTQAEERAGDGERALYRSTEDLLHAVREAGAPAPRLRLHGRGAVLRLAARGEGLVEAWARRDPELLLARLRLEGCGGRLFVAPAGDRVTLLAPRYR
jgi:signal transduction histidine kinase